MVGSSGFNFCRTLLFVFVVASLINGCDGNRMERDGENTMKKPLSGNESFDIKNSELSKIKREAYNGAADAAFRLYQYYDFVRLDYKEGMYWLTVAAENGHPVAQYNLARRLLDDQDKLKKQRARFWLKKLAEKGDHDAVEMLKKIPE